MLIVDDYNGNPDPGEMQEPVISRREASQLKREYDDFWFYYWLMQPYALTHQAMEFPGESKRDHLSWEELKQQIQEDREKWEAIRSNTNNG